MRLATRGSARPGVESAVVVGLSGVGRAVMVPSAEGGECLGLTLPCGLHVTRRGSGGLCSFPPTGWWNFCILFLGLRVI